MRTLSIAIATPSGNHERVEGRAEPKTFGPRRVEKCIVPAPLATPFPTWYPSSFWVGEVAERSKAHASKACVPIGYRGFESHPLRCSRVGGPRAMLLAERRRGSLRGHVNAYSVWVRERCPSGRRGAPGERVYPKGTVGSNPTLSVNDPTAASRPYESVEGRGGP
jgi:hypothetical protein